MTEKCLDLIMYGFEKNPEPQMRIDMMTTHESRYSLKSVVF